MRDRFLSKIKILLTEKLTWSTIDSVIAHLSDSGHRTAKIAAFGIIHHVSNKNLEVLRVHEQNTDASVTNRQYSSELYDKKALVNRSCFYGLISRSHVSHTLTNHKRISIINQFLHWQRPYLLHNLINKLIHLNVWASRWYHEKTMFRSIIFCFQEFTIHSDWSF